MLGIVPPCFPLPDSVTFCPPSPKVTGRGTARTSVPLGVVKPILQLYGMKATPLSPASPCRVFLGEEAGRKRGRIQAFGRGTILGIDALCTKMC